MAAVAALALVAATPAEVIPDLETNGYHIEPGAGASEEVVTDAVSEGRNAGGRLYLVVLATEPPGGATAFSDSVLDELPEGSYVVTVAPETVGFAENGDVWSTEQMNEAVQASLDGGSDDDVVQLFIETLVASDAPVGPGPAEPAEAPEPGAGGGLSLGWILVLGAGAFVVW